MIAAQFWGGPLDGMMQLLKYPNPVFDTPKVLPVRAGDEEIRTVNVRYRRMGNMYADPVTYLYEGQR